MPRETVSSLNEQEFVRSALLENTRLDSRNFDEFRPIALEYGDDYGHADVRIGKTRVLVKISCEVVAPYVERKFDGIFTISTELSPIASVGFEIGRPDQIEMILSRLLEKTLRRSGALDTESLCIIAGKKCFSVRADVHILDHDGNLMDASCLALVAALLHFRRPDVEVHGEDVTVFSTSERDPVKLSMHHNPFSVTFSYYHSGSVMIQDATLLEEHCREGEITVSMNRFGEICQIAKYGGTPVDGVRMLTCANLALDRVKQLDKLVRERLARDDKQRNKGGLLAELSAQNERVMEPPVG